MKSCSCHANWCYESVWRCAVRVTFLTRGVAAGFGHHCMPPPGCNNIAAILLMSWATLLPILIILRLFVLELWAGRVRHTMWPCDLVLWSWRSWWWLVMRGFVLDLRTKFAVRRPYHLEDMRYFVCENKSICDLELWPFWPWSWCGTLHVSCWNFLPILIFLRLFILELWAARVRQTM